MMPKLKTSDFTPEMIKDLAIIQKWMSEGTPKWVTPDSFICDDVDGQVIYQLDYQGTTLIAEYDSVREVLDVVDAIDGESVLVLGKVFLDYNDKYTSVSESTKLIPASSINTDLSEDDSKEDTKSDRLVPLGGANHLVTIRPSKRRRKLTTVVDTPIALNESMSEGISDFVIEVFVGAEELASNGFGSFNPVGVAPLDAPIGYLIRGINDATHTGRRVYASVSQGPQDGSVLLVVQLNYSNGNVVTSTMKSMMDGLTGVSQLTEIVKMALGAAIESKKVTTAYSFLLNTLKSISEVTTVRTSTLESRSVKITSESMLARRVTK